MSYIRTISAGALILLSGMGGGAHVAAQQPAPKNGKATVGNSLGMKLVLIPKGEFMMGSKELISELPIHKVRLTKDCYLSPGQ